MLHFQVWICGARWNSRERRLESNYWPSSQTENLGRLLQANSLTWGLSVCPWVTTNIIATNFQFDRTCPMPTNSRHIAVFWQTNLCRKHGQTVNMWQDQSTIGIISRLLDNREYIRTIADVMWIIVNITSVKEAVVFAESASCGRMGWTATGPPVNTTWEWTDCCWQSDAQGFILTYFLTFEAAWSTSQSCQMMPNFWGNHPTHIV